MLKRQFAVLCARPLCPASRYAKLTVVLALALYFIFIVYFSGTNLLIQLLARKQISTFPTMPNFSLRIDFLSESCINVAILKTRQNKKI